MIIKSKSKPLQSGNTSSCRAENRYTRQSSKKETKLKVEITKVNKPEQIQQKADDNDYLDRNTIGDNRPLNKGKSTLRREESPKTGAHTCHLNDIYKKTPSKLSSFAEQHKTAESNKDLIDAHIDIANKNDTYQERNESKNAPNYTYKSVFVSNDISPNLVINKGILSYKDSVNKESVMT